MSRTDLLLANAGRYAARFAEQNEQKPEPHSSVDVAIVACMDGRLNIHALFGLHEGDAHVIRNAGGVVTADTLRSLAVSQHLLGSREIVLVHHTDCGMLTFTDDELRHRLEEETGIRPPWAAEAFADLDADVRQSIARIEADPFVRYKDSVRGFVYDVQNGSLREVA